MRTISVIMGGCISAAVVIWLLLAFTEGLSPTGSNYGDKRLLALAPPDQQSYHLEAMDKYDALQSARATRNSIKIGRALDEFRAFMLRGRLDVKGWVGTVEVIEKKSEPQFGEQMNCVLSWNGQKFLVFIQNNMVFNKQSTKHYSQVESIMAELSAGDHVRLDGGMVVHRQGARITCLDLFQGRMITNQWVYEQYDSLNMSVVAVSKLDRIVLDETQP